MHRRPAAGRRLSCPTATLLDTADRTGQCAACTQLDRSRSIATDTRLAGVLWRIELEGDDPRVMVEVVDSTPEPDGTRRTPWLWVPPRTRTARKGVAWTFGLEESDYVPQKQT